MKFSIGDLGTDFKAATFQNYKEKNDYCAAENSSRACINAYLRHRKSETTEQAKITAYQLAKTRYNFYLKWEKARAKNRPAKLVPPPTNVA